MSEHIHYVTDDTFDAEVLQSQQPVLVDLLDGGVYALPDDGHTGQCRFENLPLADSPLVVCDRTMVELTP